MRKSEKLFLYGLGSIVLMNCLVNFALSNLMAMAGLIFGLSGVVSLMWALIIQGDK